MTSAEKYNSKDMSGSAITVILEIICVINCDIAATIIIFFLSEILMMDSPYFIR